MDKRYQVFVSSTYEDLREARQAVILALLEFGCMPAGMELFPAADDDQWTLIKRIIDESDYYLVVVAGRYGSTDEQGMSYTEKEYRYALETKKPILGFVHAEPGSIPLQFCENTEARRQQLELFRDLVKKKTCKMWTTPAELAGAVTQSIVKLVSLHRAVGWIRADQAVPAAEYVRMSQRIEELERETKAFANRPPASAEGLAQGVHEFPLRFVIQAGYAFAGNWRAYTVETQKLITWNQLFAICAPRLIRPCSSSSLQRALGSYLHKVCLPELPKLSGDALPRRGADTPEIQIKSIDVSFEDFDTILIQFRALGLIVHVPDVESKDPSAIFWTLTPFGDTEMTRIRAIRIDQ